MKATKLWKDTMENLQNSQNLPGPVLHQILKYLLNSLEFPE